MKKIIFTLLAMSLVAFFSVTQAQNLVVNGDLEAWTSDTEPTGWTKAESISKESTVLHGGSFAAKHTSGDGTLDFSQDVEGIEAGTTYTISYYYYDNSDMARGRIWAYWMDADGTYLNDNEDVLRPTTYSEDQDAWMHYEQVLTAPAGAAKFRFEVRVYKQDGAFGGALYYDDFSITGDLVIKPEPTNYPTAFAAETEDIGVRLNWTDATGAQLPDAYLIIGETAATKDVNFDLPVDGTPVANNTDISMGYIAWNVPYGQATHFFSNLESGTAYHFAIFPYTNLGENIDYKNDAGYPEVTIETSDIIVLLNEPFDSSLGVMSGYNVLGDQEWEHSTFGEDQFAKMSGYAGSANDNEDWLISPELDFTDLEKAELSFRTAYNYDGNPMQLMVSNDYDGTGNPNDFTWTDLTNEFDWSEGGFEWAESGVVDILSYASPTVYVAFKYTSTTAGASTWEVDYVRVIGEGSVGVNENKMLDVQVYPNPVVDQLNFTLTEQAKVQVIDLSGKTVMQQDVTVGNSSINVADLNQGMYIVYFNFADGTQAVSRFAKQ